MLLLIVVAFAVVGVLCARILYTRVKPIGVDAAYDAFIATVGRTLRRQMLGTTGFIFATFLLRSVFSTLRAVALRLRDSGCTVAPHNTIAPLEARLLSKPNPRQLAPARHSQ